MTYQNKNPPKRKALEGQKTFKENNLQNFK